jgi:hypothetical protein
MGAEKRGVRLFYRANAAIPNRPIMRMMYEHGRPKGSFRGCDAQRVRFGEFFI